MDRFPPLARIWTASVVMITRFSSSIRAIWVFIPVGKAFSPRHPQIILSAKTGDGISSLRARLRESLLGKSDLPEEIVTRERHVLALQQASMGLSQALQSLEFGNPGEIIAMDLRVALDALAAIIGETTPDDVLDRIFKTFLYWQIMLNRSGPVLNHHGMTRPIMLD